MNFAKKLEKHENVVTRSGLKLLPAVPQHEEITASTDLDKKEFVDQLLIKSANKAAKDLFLSSGAKIYSTINKNTRKKHDAKDTDISDSNQNLALVDCKLYPTQLLPPSSKILPESLVVIFESFDSLTFVYATPGEVFHNRNGHFHHNDFINKPYGCKIRSRTNRGYGYVYCLRPTPELWARSLNHRTQIVHELDASMIIFNLNLRPNMVVCESGTGSGAMSHCFLRSIAPYGKLHTYEFNKARADAARDEFKMNGVGHLVDVHWRDVCGKSKDASSGGFEIGPAKAHAIFLDLPEPWLAIPHAAHTIKPNGSICSYSPCVEQTGRTSEAMKEYGFHSIKTIEVRLREHYVDEAELDPVPTVKLAREPIEVYVPGAPDNDDEVEEKDEGEEKIKNNKTTKNGQDTNTTVKDESGGKDVKMEDNKEQTSTTQAPLKKRKMWCARPFATMRGHTAFLTFAYAGNKAHPDPNKASEQ